MSAKTQIGFRVVSGPDKGKVFIIEGTSFIGIGSNCAVCLSDPALSAMHARYQVKGITLHVTDLTPEPDMKINGVFEIEHEIDVM